MTNQYTFTVTWQSSDIKVATVVKTTDKVIGRGTGAVKITTTAGGKSKTLTITEHRYETVFDTPFRIR